MKYHKLVRDKIPEIILKNNQIPTIRIANKQEYETLLLKKLREEVKEFSNNQNKEEFADILEVLDAIGHHKGFERKEILAIKKKKQQDNGGFKEKIVLEKVKITRQKRN